MGSRKKLISNRANAQKSTGPKTPEGKAVVSLNALSHGLLAETVLLPDENDELFAAFSAGLRERFAPEGELEALLTDRVISSAWRLRRALEAEGYVMWRHCSLGQVFLNFNASSTFGLLNRYEAHVERGLFRALHELQRLQAARSGQAVPPPVSLDLHVHEE